MYLVFPWVVNVSGSGANDPIRTAMLPDAR